MVLAGPRARTAARIAAACTVAVLWTSVARGEGVSVYLQPEFSHEETESTDQTNRTLRTSRNILTHNYRLQLDKDLFPSLRVTAGGSFQDSVTWAHGDTGSSRTDDRTTDVFGRLSLNIPMLNGGVGYDRRDTSA